MYRFGARPTDVLAMIIACLIVLGAVGAAIAIGVRALNRRVARLEAQVAPSGWPSPGHAYRAAPGPHSSSSPVELAPLYYVLSVLFWPVAFGLGGYLLLEPRTARVGRNCVFIGMGLIGTVTLLTCMGMSAATVYFARTSNQGSTRPAPATTPAPLRSARSPGTPFRPTPAEVVVTGHVGEGVRLGDLVVRVHSVDRSYVPSQTYAREPGGRWITIDLSFKNEGSSALHVGTYQLHLFDREGHVATTSYVAAKKPSFTSTSLAPGRVVRGWVIFRLPADAADDRLQVRNVGARTNARIAEISLND